MSKQTAVWMLVFVAMACVGLSAQPWVIAASNLEISVRIIVRYLAYIAIVFGGITYMFAGPGSHRILAGIFVGGVFALGATSIVAWFPA